MQQICERCVDSDYLKKNERKQRIEGKSKEIQNCSNKILCGNSCRTLTQ